MRLSEMIIAEMGAWPRTSSLCRVLDECLELAKRYEDAPVLPVEGVITAGLIWGTIDVTGYVEVDQRVRIVLDKEG